MPEFPLYLDPTAAGLGLQMLLGAIVGGVVGVRLFWERILSLFRRRKPNAEETLAASEESSEAIEQETSLRR